MRPDQYIESKGLTQAAFGAQLRPPVTQSLVSQWFRGKTRITLDQALEIERISAGEVTPRECAEMFRPTETEPAAA